MIPAKLKVAIALLLVTSLTQTAFAFDDVTFQREIRGLFEQPVDVSVDREGNLYVLDAKLSQVSVYSREGRLLREFGSKGRQPGQLNRPKALAINPDGEILVVDTGNHRVQVFSPEGRFLYGFGGAGKLRGQFRSPAGIKVSAFGIIYVADSMNMRVQIFFPKGVYAGQIALTSAPQGLDLDRQGNLYILLPELGRISKYSARGKWQATIAGAQNGKNYSQYGVSLFVDHRGDIYLVEDKEESIKKFSGNGSLLASVGSEGKGRGQFNNPSGLFVDARDRLYVADTRNKRIQVFTVSGAPRKSMEATREAPPRVIFQAAHTAQPGIIDLLVQDDRLIYLYDKNNQLILKASPTKVIGEAGRESGQFKLPKSVYQAEDGRIYVADTGNNRVQVFKANGKFDFTFGSRGRKTGQLNGPQGIVVNSKGLIYVADTKNHRIQIFNRQGIFLSAFGEKSSNNKDEKPAKGSFMLPTELALDKNENLYVVDGGNNRIQVFSGTGDFLRSFGEFGDQYVQFNNPVDIAIDSSGKIVIAEQGNHRLQLLSSNGVPLLIFGSPGAGIGEMSMLSSVAVKDDSIYVADYNHDKIRQFRYTPSVSFSLPKAKPVKEKRQQKEPIQDAEEDEFELR